MANEEQKQPTEGLNRRLRRWLRNPISMAGLAIAIVSAANILFFVVIDLTAAKASPYVGILAYMVAPGFLVFSLVLIGFGGWREIQSTRD